MHKNDHLELAKCYEEMAELFGEDDKHIIGLIVAHHYAALHYIDAYLYEIVKPPEENSPSCHKDDFSPHRSRYHIMQNNIDKDIFDRYERLHDYSQRSRYKRGFRDFPPKRKQIEPFIKDDLRQIKKYVLGKLKTA